VKPPPEAHKTLRSGEVVEDAATTDFFDSKVGTTFGGKKGIEKL
jgi:hypothetical protein